LTKSWEVLATVKLRASDADSALPLERASPPLPKRDGPNTAPPRSSGLFEPPEHGRETAPVSRRAGTARAHLEIKRALGHQAHFATNHRIGFPARHRGGNSAHNEPRTEEEVRVENPAGFVHLHDSMKFRRFFVFLVGAFLAAGPGCTKSAKAPERVIDLSEPIQAQPKLPTIELWAGPGRIEAEMALTPAQERTGMMFRTQMGENEGMIFVFPPQQASFWMKNCSLPLSVAYIDPDGVIREIHDLQPYDTNAVLSASQNIAYALETPQGWFRRHQVRTGMTVRSERGSLMDTFQRGR
jgi:uncharacterized protein